MDYNAKSHPFQFNSFLGAPLPIMENHFLLLQKTILFKSRLISDFPLRMYYFYARDCSKDEFELQNVRWSIVGAVYRHNIRSLRWTRNSNRSFTNPDVMSKDSCSIQFENCICSRTLALKRQVYNVKAAWFILLFPEKSTQMKTVIQIIFLTEWGFMIYYPRKWI